MNNISTLLNPLKESIRKIGDDMYSGRCNHCSLPQCSEGVVLLRQINELLPQIREHRAIYDTLAWRRDNFWNNGRINPYSFGGISDTICILEALLNDRFANGKRIFISHSSQNAEIVGLFTDLILQLGIGISSDDIFCTSIEDMKIENGEDIRKHIHDNIKSADFSFLFLSDEYKASEICLNEMGAVWAYDSNIRYYTLPNFKFTEIGWLCSPKSAEALIDDSTLDGIQRELRDFYHLKDKGATWSKQRKNFIAQCNQL